MAFDLGTILGSNLGSMFKDIVGTFKLDPAKKAELQAAIDENAQQIALKQLDLQGKLQDAVSNEVSQAADVIKAEANSQSWLPRNVRPACLAAWAFLITFNYFIPIVAQLFHNQLTPIVLDPWVYKLTAIGFTGYVTARTWEKVKDSDN